MDVESIRAAYRPVGKAQNYLGLCDYCVGFDLYYQIGVDQR